MMMKFKNRDEWIKRHVDASALVERVVGEAGLYSSGTIETLDAEVRMLTDIVGRLASMLPESAMIELAASYGYEPVKSTTQP